MNEKRESVDQKTSQEATAMVQMSLLLLNPQQTLGAVNKGGGRTGW